MKFISNCILLILLSSAATSQSAIDSDIRKRTCDLLLTHDSSRSSVRRLIENIGTQPLKNIFDEMTTIHFQYYRRFLGGVHLDVGSGDGMNAMMIRTQGAARVEMIDLYNESLNEAVRTRLNYDSNFNHTVYKSGSVLPFSAGYFSSVSLFYVLHHCPSRESALALLIEIRRTMQKNGRLIVIEELYKSEEQKEFLMNMDQALSEIFYPAQFDPKHNLFEPSHFFQRDSGELEALFHSAGFQIKASYSPDFLSSVFPRTIYILQEAMLPE